MDRKISRAIISVSYKKGVVEFARGLKELGVEILSTGGTAMLLNREGVKVTSISDYTGFSEILDGRVKTLHPRIHGGILAQRDKEKHVEEMEFNGIEPIDMVVVNLYPFEYTVARGASLEEIIENIDIGGPTMLRAAAKNYRDVAAVTNSEDYPKILEEMKSKGGCLSLETRFTLSKKAFQLTARYDGNISNYLGKLEGEREEKEFPDTLTMHLKKIQDLRYGENPHQSGAFYRETGVGDPGVANAEKIQGKALSFNNILDLNSAIELAKAFHEPAVVIVKHNNPCGVATSVEDIKTAYLKALATDPVSAFGGVIGTNRPLDKPTALEIARIFSEAIIAPDFTKEAIEVLKTKKNLRLLKIPDARCQIPDAKYRMSDVKHYGLKKIKGGALVQTLNEAVVERKDLKVVTKRQPTDEEIEAMLFAWRVIKYVRSNAIVYAKHRQALGIGAGQMSRIDAAKIGIMKAKDATLNLNGAVMASDAFFPFRDCIDFVAGEGIRAVIQPGGSIRDEKVIQAANEHNMAMVFTGIRYFRH
ncbi:MAG: bifunctional phosphoribosylaminoimidazolecarboxamide formyltransferase/IMP cyclohydrolase [Thermodesulfobacteriota bacterium]